MRLRELIALLGGNGSLAARGTGGAAGTAGDRLPQQSARVRRPSASPSIAGVLQCRREQWVGAMCGPLRVGKGFLHVEGLGGAAMCSACQRGSQAAAPNALRGSDLGQKPTFDNALALVGCPDRRFERLCITCCSPSQPSHHGGFADEEITVRAADVGWGIAGLLALGRKRIGAIGDPYR
jgi:hypothetical protein